MSKWSFWRKMRRMEFGAGWRARLAKQYVESGNRRMPVEFDGITRSFAEYSRLKVLGERAATEAAERFPHFVLAESAWSQPHLRASTQLLLLASIAGSEICELLELEEDVLATIEDIFFDVRAMLSSAPWIVGRVIAPEADAGRDDLAAQMRVAYFHGPYAAKSLIEAKTTLQTDSARQLADASILLHAKLIQALEMPLTPERSLELIRLFTEISRDEKVIQLEREKLAFRTKRWHQRCEMQQMRMARDGKVPSTAEAGYTASPDAQPTADAT